MTDDKQITKIQVKFYGTEKGKRKVTFQGIDLVELDGHLTFTPDDLKSQYSNQAFEAVKPYRNVSKIRLWVRHGWDKGPHITSIKLLPDCEVYL